MLRLSVLVMCGRLMGAWLRFALQQKTLWQVGGVNAATLLINAIGGAVMGGLAVWWVTGKSLPEQAVWRALRVNGFCGGFTTFSAFSLEMWQLLQAGKPLSALTMAVAHVVLSLLAVVAGWCLVRSVWH